MNSAVGPSFKVVFAKKSTCNPMNSARDLHKKHRRASAFLFNAIQTCTKYGSTDIYVLKN